MRFFAFDPVVNQCDTVRQHDQVARPRFQFVAVRVTQLARSSRDLRCAQCRQHLAVRTFLRFVVHEDKIVSNGLRQVLTVNLTTVVRDAGIDQRRPTSTEHVESADVAMPAVLVKLDGGHRRLRPPAAAHDRLADRTKSTHRYRHVRRRFLDVIVVPKQCPRHARRGDRSTIKPGSLPVPLMFDQTRMQIGVPGDFVTRIAKVHDPRLHAARARVHHHAPDQMVQQVGRHVFEEVLVGHTSKSVREGGHVHHRIVHVSDGFLVAAVHADIPVRRSDDGNRLGSIPWIRIVHEPVAAAVVQPGPHPIAHQSGPWPGLRMFVENRQGTDARRPRTDHHPVAAGDLMSRDLRGPDRISPIVNKRADTFLNNGFAYGDALILRQVRIEQVVADGNGCRHHGCL